MNQILNVLPTTSLPAKELATSNWPIAIAQVGSQKYGAYGAGGLQIPTNEPPLNIVPWPLRPLPPGMVVLAYGNPPIPAVVDMNPVPESTVLAGPGQTLYLDQGAQLYLLNALQRIEEAMK